MKLCFCPLLPRFSPNLKGGAMQDFLADIFGSCSAPPPSSGGESSEILGKLLGKFWGRIFCKFWGRIFSASFGAESSLQVLGQNLPPGSGGKLWGKFWDRIFFSRSLPPAAKTPKLPRYKRGDARTSVHLPPPSTSPVESPPPFGVPSRDGPFGVSALKGPVSLGWSLLTWGSRTSFRSGIWHSFHNPPFYSDPEGRHVPCLGVCPYPSQKAWPHRPLGPP